jgi:hypothetical protein
MNTPVMVVSESHMIEHLGRSLLCMQVALHISWEDNHALPVGQV